MGIYDFLPKGSQVKLWGCNLELKKVGDSVPSFNIPEYVILLRAGGYVIVKNDIITKIVENKGTKYYYPKDFPYMPCFDKWGNHVNNDIDLEDNGIMGEQYYYE